MKKKALVIYNPMAGKKKLLNTKRTIETTLKKAGYDFDFLKPNPWIDSPWNAF